MKEYNIFPGQQSFAPSFADREISRHEYDMAYSGYMNAYFPGFREEYPRPAIRFADTIDLAYDLGEHKFDEDPRDAMNDAWRTSWKIARTAICSKFRNATGFPVAFFDGYSAVA